MAKAGKNALGSSTGYQTSKRRQIGATFVGVFALFKFGVGCVPPSSEKPPPPPPTTAAPAANFRDESLGVFNAANGTGHFELQISTDDDDCFGSAANPSQSIEDYFTDTLESLNPGGSEALTASRPNGQVDPVIFRAYSTLEAQQMAGRNVLVVGPSSINQQLVPNTRATLIIAATFADGTFANFTALDEARSKFSDTSPPPLGYGDGKYPKC